MADNDLSRKNTKTAPWGMEYRYSREIPEETIQRHAYHSIFTPRVSIAAEITEKALLQCRADFIAAGYADIVKTAAQNTLDGGIIGNATALMFCEGRPDRLWAISYMMEWGAVSSHLRLLPLLP